MREQKTLRTCAYCRVSTVSDLQDGSFETQCAYYERVIQNNPDMELVGVYGDHGKSGRAMRNRTELNRMIHDCEAGKIDLVLTKVFCGDCGAPMTRRTVNGCGGEKRKVWTCRERHKGRQGNGCKCRNICEEELLSAISDHLGALVTDANIDDFERVTVCKDKMKVE